MFPGFTLSFWAQENHNGDLGGNGHGNGQVQDETIRPYNGRYDVFFNIVIDGGETEFYNDPYNDLTSSPSDYEVEPSLCSIIDFPGDTEDCVDPSVAPAYRIGNMEYDTQFAAFNPHYTDNIPEDHALTEYYREPSFKENISTYNLRVEPSLCSIIDFPGDTEDCVDPSVAPAYRTGTMTYDTEFATFNPHYTDNIPADHALTEYYRETSVSDTINVNNLTVQPELA